jgi:hypothetical protein
MNLIESSKRLSAALKAWKAGRGGNNVVSLKAELDEANRLSNVASAIDLHQRRRNASSVAPPKIADQRTATSAPATVAVRVELPVAQAPTVAAVPTTRAITDQAAIDASVAQIRQHAGLDASPRSAEVNRIRENAGLDAQPRSADVNRIRQNAGLDPQPRSAEVVRIVGSYAPSLLTAAERQSVMSPEVVRIARNYQRLRGFAVLPVDVEAEKSCNRSR